MTSLHFYTLHKTTLFPDLQPVYTYLIKQFCLQHGNATTSSETSVGTNTATATATAGPSKGPPPAAKFRHGLLQLMIHTIDPMHDGELGTHRASLHLHYAKIQCAGWLIIEIKKKTK